MTLSTSLLQGDVYQVAFDIGSGSLKMQSAWVDPIVCRISKKMETISLHIPLRDSIDQDPNLNIPEEMVQRLISSILDLKIQAAVHGSIFKCVGVGTESFRIAKNGKEVLSRIQNETDVLLFCPSPSEEALLGRKALIAEGILSKDADFISWENGGGSMQIATASEGKLLSFNKSLGKIPVKNHLMSQIQGKDIRENASPNPISKQEALQTISWIQSHLDDTPTWLSSKISSCEVIGLGGMFACVQRKLHKAEFTKEEVYQLLALQLGKTDQELSQTEDSTFMVLDPLFLYAIMSALNIEKVRFERVTGSTSALLVDFVNTD